MALSIIKSFHYLHEPLGCDEAVIPFLGNQTCVDDLKSRLGRSSGGAFLITGFRGVGKTTVVQRALDEMAREQRAAHRPRLLPVYLNIARPVTTNQLLFEIVRRLYEELLDRGIFERLPPATADAIMRAYMRTSLSFKETQGTSQERSASVGLAGGKGEKTIAAAALSLLVPTLGASVKRVRSRAVEASFLAYSESDVEHDFVRIIQLLAGVPAHAKQSPWWRRGLERLGLLKPRPEHPGRVVVVLDELDKLTSTPQGQTALDDLLSGMKNLLTMKGVHFLFVGGPDLHDRFLSDANRGNSVYESVFAFSMYVPCVWTAAEGLLGALLDRPPSNKETDTAPGTFPVAPPVLRRYLQHKARGVPRRLLHEFNSMVRWSETGQPFIDDKIGPWISFYAVLQETLERFFSSAAADGKLFPGAIDNDRFQLGIYYVTDWILRTEGRVFTVPELASVDHGGPVDAALHLTPTRLERLVEHLIAHDVVEELEKQDANRRIIGDVPEAQARLFRLLSNVREKLAQIASRSERERIELGLPARAIPAAQEARPGTPPPSPVATSSLRPTAIAGSTVTVLHNRYELRRILGQGGMGAVYAGYDTVLGREVAIKVLSEHVLGSPTVRARFQREGRISLALSHPQIVRTYDFVDDDVVLALVMELIAGENLASAVRAGPFNAAHAVDIAMKLLGALQYLNDQGMWRFDIKPSNILLRAAGDPVLIDFGIAKTSAAASEFSTMEGAFIGTPAYAAPELLRSERYCDIRSDVYSLALVLIETLTGRTARKTGDNVNESILIAMRDPIDLTPLDVSLPLRSVIAKATSPYPDDRYTTPADMMAALSTVPEVVPTVLPPTTSQGVATLG